jgi:hypothetical protein
MDSELIALAINLASRYFYFAVLNRHFRFLVFSSLLFVTIYLNMNLSSSLNAEVMAQGDGLERLLRRLRVT